MCSLILPADQAVIWNVCEGHGNKRAVHHTCKHHTPSCSQTHTQGMFSVRCAVQCGAPGALNKNILVERCIRCLSTHGKKDMLIPDLTVASS